MMERAFIETKVLSDDAGAVSGIAWKYGEADRIGDMIAPGAFAKAAFPLPLLFAHDIADPVGIWEKGEDRGDAWHISGKLLVEDVSRAREVSSLVKSGAVRGLSVGFMVGKAEPRKGGGRLIKSLELLEISLVSIPMHAGAKVVSAKSAVQAIRLAQLLNGAARHIMKGN